MIFFGHLGITLLFVFVVFYFLKDKVDYRFVLIGAILPDLIDKPIGDYIFFSVFRTGRIFAHTLLFIVLLTLIGMYVNKKYRFNGVELLALGAMMHLAEDQLWLDPQTLFWPVFGLKFPVYANLSNYAGYILNKLLTQPDVYIPEIVGIIILATFTIYYKLYKPENLIAFIRTGKFPTRIIEKKPHQIAE